MGDEMIYIVILLVYLAGMLVIGFISSKKVTNSKSYYTSDRNVSAAVTGFSYSSTQLSSGSTIGMPATVYTQGYSYMGTPMAAAAAPWFTFLLTGERVRKISERVDAIDYGDIFRARFGNASKILYELLIIVFAIPTIISPVRGRGQLGTEPDRDFLQCCDSHDRGGVNHLHHVRRHELRGADRLYPGHHHDRGLRHSGGYSAHKGGRIYRHARGHRGHGPGSSEADGKGQQNLGHLLYHHLVHPDGGRQHHLGGAFPDPQGFKGAPGRAGLLGVL